MIRSVGLSGARDANSSTSAARAIVLPMGSRSGSIKNPPAVYDKKGYALFLPGHSPARLQSQGDSFFPLVSAVKTQAFNCINPGTTRLSILRAYFPTS
ncbi:hypothetical protein N7468_009303 [Penicillium chermesinum]|uniref:Uncharacterized protein n=1 Tax=Penicillium chermesinum TaxID=63820 RepID=A0A9W9TF45_9EURO|nr:uncharacterized protein N7468_009303 [Penicillium chermesinum]KAJ5220099.1 hypothetical protein N7468_009303 [Penicillium chermesinum]KAJ6157546.1 hypothetical protein N7470_005138 [Penicillium chermesinum]